LFGGAEILEVLVVAQHSYREIGPF
jgi:hypothetical protein